MSNPEQPVLDAIDELVDESLSKSWEEISGYDNDIHQPDCPHELCSREWHGLPDGRCPGSAVFGPVKPPIANRYREMAERLATAPYQYAGGGPVETSGLVGVEIGGRVFTGRFECGGAAAFEAARRSINAMAEALSSIWQIPDDPLNPAAWNFADDFIEATTEPVPETPQQRALPRPSTRPPMWAVRADGRRR